MIIPVLHSLNSPENVGSIVRSHRAFGGTQLVFVGHQLPWRFRKSTQAFSRSLEKQLDIIYLENSEQLFEWCRSSGASPIALEITEDAIPLNQFEIPKHVALICGNEATGLPSELIEQCDEIVVIPQTGPVGSLNVATACSIALYTYAMAFGQPQPIAGRKFTGEN